VKRAGGAQGPTAQLRVLATTDLHAHLMAHDYFTDRPSRTAGLVWTASLIRRLRAGSDNTVLFDNGDFLQGNPMSDWVAANPTALADAAHPMIAAMNALGYDAGTLGNHEFNYGLEFLAEALRGATFPVVSANTLDEAGQPLVRPYVVLDRKISDDDGASWPVGIGVIGLAPPQIALWERISLGDRIGTRDILATARELVPRMKAEGADVIVALCHSGIGAERAEPGMENAAVPLAAVEGIDAIVTGHTHQVFPGPAWAEGGAIDPAGLLHGKPAVMAGYHGSHLGVIDLSLFREDGRWRVTEGASLAVPIADRQDPVVRRDPAVMAIGRGVHRRVLAEVRKPLGETTVPLQSFFSLVGPDACLQLVADAQRARAVEALAGTAYAGLPLLSAVAPFKTGGRAGPDNYVDIPPGTLVQRHVSELYPYPNGFCILVIRGTDVALWLERSVSLFHRLVPGVMDQPLIDPGFPGYNFDMLDGAEYVVDPTQPARTDASGRVLDAGAQRIVALMIGGRALDKDETVLVATNGYRAGGGGGFAAAISGTVVHKDALSTREVVLDHIRRTSPVAPVACPTWRFADNPGTGAWFDSGRGAGAHATGAIYLGDTEELFRRYRIAF